MALNNKRQSLAITGASGYIGRHLLPLLAQRYEISILSRNKPKAPLLPHMRWERFDLVEDDAADIFRRKECEILVHLAWAIPFVSYWTNSDNLVWLKKSIELLKAFIASGGKHVHIAGTCAEYNWLGEMPLAEDKSQLKPRAAYGKCKNALRCIGKHLCHAEDLSFAWYRIFWLYGGDQDQRKFIPSLLDAFAQNRKARCLGANLQRDYIHVADAAAIIYAGIREHLDGVLNVCSGKAYFLDEIAGQIASNMQAESLLSLGNMHTDWENPPIVCGSLEKQKKLLNYKLHHQLEADIKEMVNNLFKRG